VAVVRDYKRKGLDNLSQLGSSIIRVLFSVFRSVYREAGASIEKTRKQPNLAIHFHLKQMVDQRRQILEGFFAQQKSEAVRGYGEVRVN
jgi:hypothetical protein